MIRLRHTQRPIPLGGWLLSYADMATILLALFIVVSVLSRDQTGNTFYRGSGSYLQALHRISHLRQAPFQEQQHSREDPAEEETLEQLVFELAREYPVMRLPPQARQEIVDLYQPLSSKTPSLRPQHQEALQRLLPLLERADYRVQVIVWAATPAPSAWARAAGQAQQACDELISSHHLPAEVAGRLTAVAQPWPYRDIRRPVLSLVLLKKED